MGVSVKVPKIILDKCTEMYITGLFSIQDIIGNAIRQFHEMYLGMRELIIPPHFFLRKSEFTPLSLSNKYAQMLDSVIDGILIKSRSQAIIYAMWYYDMNRKNHFRDFVIKEVN